MTTYVWDGAALRPGEVAGETRVADSWRRIDGRVRRFDLHRARFTRAVRESGAGVDVDAFLDAVSAVPGEGEWFPRVRLVGSDLLLDVRPGPPRRPTAVVRVLPAGDPRTMPRVKGPDLALIGGLVDEARGCGADEVLLRDGAGRVLEAGYAALVWWDGDVLCLPDAQLPVLPSVTRRIVEERARSVGTRVRSVDADLGALDGCEAWLLNAYQGLRVVTAWQGTAITAGPQRRAPAWRAWLDEV